MSYKGFNRHRKANRYYASGGRGWSFTLRKYSLQINIGSLQSAARKNEATGAKAAGHRRGCHVYGLTQKISGRKYYDFVIHYVKETSGKPPSLRTKVLFPSPFGSGPNTGKNIRQLLKDTLYASMSINFDKFMEQFTFVTEFAAVIPIVVGSFASTTRCKWDESWSPGIVHMLNTAMKKAMIEMNKAVEAQNVPMFKD